MLRALRSAGLFLALLACSDGDLTGPAPADPLLSTSATQRTDVVISQVYGGGGNSGATLRNDFIELFNPGTQPVSLAGWSVQYASASGSTWQVTPLSGTIQPGGYYLVQEAAGTGGTTSLPTPDATGNIPMSATAGKVWLVKQTTALSGTCPAGSTVVDQVSFGGTASLCGSFGTTANLSNTTAAIRNNNGCKYTGSIPADFSVAAPAPRNSGSPVFICPVDDTQPATVTVVPVSETVTVGSTQAFMAKAFNAFGQEISGVAFTWTSSNTAVATVSGTGVATAVAAGTANITATAPNGVSGSAALTVQSAGGGSATNVRVTEFHYDNDGADTGEAIELEGDASGSLAGWKLVLYSGSTGSSTQGQSYATINLSGVFGTACGGTRGVLVFDAPGLQNGDKDGFALVNAAGQVVEFLSYEGSFTAVSGPAAGMTSTDVSVDEDPAPVVGRSLQRAGNGVWFGPSAHTFGACNPAEPPRPQTGISFSGRTASDPALPVGFQDQLFATLRDANTNAVIPTIFAWSSETPSIASVDQDGVVTALAAGTAVLRATATDGTTSTYSLPTRVATASGSAQYGHNTEFGEPKDGDASDDHILRYTQFTSSFNRNRGTPNWVSYNIDATHFGGEDRCDCFTYDADLPADFTRYTTAAYTGAGTFHGYGIDRGHLARSFDRTAGSLDNAHTFYFSNIIPQASDNNQGPWAAMESYLGDLARFQNREVYVIAGVAGSKGTIKNEGRITIPAQVWKVALVMPRDRGLDDVDSYDDVQVIAVVMPNDAGIRNVDWRTYQTTTDAVEALSGYDVLDLLPNTVERIVESNDRPPVATTDGPYTGIEGSPVQFSAAASSDPDGDALTYAWDFGDGATGTGATPTHTYADNGNYIVRVTVTDPYGAESTATTSVMVVNVAPTVPAFAGATLLPGETYTASGSFADPGSDSWTATVNYGDGSGAQPLALAGKAFSLSHTYAAAGTYTVTVTVADDDGDSTARTATVTVQTPQQGVQGIAAMVGGLVDGGALSNGEGSALQASLRAAVQQLDRRDGPAAVNQLQAFIYQVEALERSGRLSAAQAQQLIAAANRVIRSIAG
ncbi:MAG TPA: DNA/RNA non-specific endonuclease [Longimicrobiaceae bacterium]|nr:DNA/RNA non-specific endonuclease [Longimicrobiaceae bacterium]